MTKLVYTVEAMVSFSVVEIDILMATAPHHYDATCQQVAKFGGFLMGIHQGMSMGIEEHKLSFREISILSKILEMAHLITAGKRPEQTLSALKERLRTALNEINREYLRLNPE